MLLIQICVAGERTNQQTNERAHQFTILFCYLDCEIDDHHRNPNVNNIYIDDNIYHLVGRTTTSEGSEKQYIACINKVPYWTNQLHFTDRHAQRPIAFWGERKKLAIMVISPGKVISMYVRKLAIRRGGRSLVQGQ